MFVGAAVEGIGTLEVSGRDTGHLGSGADTWWEGLFYGMLSGVSLGSGGMCLL
jgi:hypothetical protein